MQWTDRIRQVKIILVVAAVAIAAASLFVSHKLVSDLKQEERSKMDLWAKAMKYINEVVDEKGLSLALEFIQSNTTIPVVVTDANGQVLDSRNIEDTARVETFAQQMRAAGDTIPIDLGEGDYLLVCYDESTLLKRLTQYPYWQLGIVMIFVVVAIFALLSSKRAEQNKVWVGLSKETAHQLGTPISSLMAWTEMLKESYPKDELIPEMEQDVKRLERIAERFSKIGSKPEPVDESMNTVLDHVIDYMNKRTSQKVSISGHYPSRDVIVKINASLFEWVIENLCKNAVDAIGTNGTIRISLYDSEKHVAIEISDTGKGISKSDFKNVFKPGYTTKNRGWGLGLSLAKRIVEEYHGGKIFVKSSEIGKGTTFRIILKK